MKLSKSKLALAKVINENGGWVDGTMQLATSNKNGSVYLWSNTPRRIRHVWDFGGRFTALRGDWRKLPNWHQTILSREEYYQAYPDADDDGWIEWKGGECPVDVELTVYVNYRDGGKTPKAVKAGSQRWNHSGLGGDIMSYRLHKQDVKPEFCESVMRSIPEPEFDDAGSRLAKAFELVKSAAPHMLRDKYKFDGNEVMGERKPTIEQLAQDYRNKLDFAKRKQQEADDAKVDADSKLKALELAGEAIGLTVSPITERQAPELVITDWRQWLVGDVVSWSLLNHAVEFEIISAHHDQSRNIGDFEVKDKQGGVYRVYGNECRFIRRP